MARKNERAVSSLTPIKFLVFVSTQHVESGELSDGSHKELFESEAEAICCFGEGIRAGRALVQSEIKIIEKPESSLIFNAPYIISSAIFRVPAELGSASRAVDWITQQLEENEDVSEHVVRYEGVSISPYREDPYSLHDFLSSWC